MRVIYEKGTNDRWYWTVLTTSNQVFAISMQGYTKQSDARRAFNRMSVLFE